MTQRDPSHQLRADDLLRGLGTRRIGRRISVLSEADSTNLYALDVLAAEAGDEADGRVVFAEHQTAGRGRLGNTWLSPRGASLLFTVLLCEDETRVSPTRLVMAAAVAVVEGISEATHVEPVIRWPNDVYVGNKKLAGILVELRTVADCVHAIAVGVGVNCLQQVSHFPAEIRDRATSLELETAQPVDRVAVARAILRHMDRTFADHGGAGDDRLAADWQAHSADLGTRVRLAHGGETFVGMVTDVHPQTGLLLQLDTGVRRAFDPATTTRHA
jgi:BirA family biotin operon repressor/biotin-[acetyl-CoA-carboxylase] ligase